MDKLIAKVNRRGVVWTSYYIEPRVLAYKMERAGSRKYDYHTIDEIVVKRAGKGWVVTAYGDVVAEAKGKNDAQREAERLLDNNKDSHGFFLETTRLR